MDKLLPEQLARNKIDKQLNEAGWDVVSRDEYIHHHPQAIKEAIMSGKTESDYLLFIENKAIAVIEAKREDNPLEDEVKKQAENYARNPIKLYGRWFDNLIPLVYISNGNKIFFKNLLDPDGEYEELDKIDSPKKMLKRIGKSSKYGALPKINIKGLRDCQYETIVSFENSIKYDKKKSLAFLATGAGKTYLACLASYRLLNYTPIDRILFLVDRNNLAKQTESEFNKFDRTENEKPLSSLYSINRLKKVEDVNGDIVISTIQKLFAVLTGNELIDNDDDDNDEDIFFKDIPDSEYTPEPSVDLGNKIILKPDHFKFIVIDECHRSIYGKWKSVLDYFKDAIVLGLTATPTPEAQAYFDNNRIARYTYEDSIQDGVNVPFRIYDIETKVTTQGGEIKDGAAITEIVKKTGKKQPLITDETITYTNKDLDKSVTNKNQIREVLKAYRDSIYTDLYPDRESKWEYIPKTLIFAKSDKHADEIIDAIKEVFKEKFDDNDTPPNFAQKITYSAGDSNKLIQNFRDNKDFRIAVTVTLVATGTDIKPLEIVMFMADIRSDVLYTQMKGRGCRTINEDKLKEVTPNAKNKDCFYIVDAVGVTKGEKLIPRMTKIESKKFKLKDLLERLSHAEVSDENLSLLKDYCVTITNRYKDNALFKKHLEEFIDKHGYSPMDINEKIKNALDAGTLPPYNNTSEPNNERFLLISELIDNNEAKRKLLELQKGYTVFTPDDEPDELLSKGFSIESAKKFIENFEKYLDEHKDYIEALRIIYNSEDILITNSMLCKLRDSLLSANKQYTSHNIWNHYKRLDNDGKVKEFDYKHNVNALTNLIQLAKYAYNKNNELFSLFGVYSQRFNLYVGRINHTLDENQIEIMRKIANYIVDGGSISTNELQDINTDLWREGYNAFSKSFESEVNILSKYIIKVA